MVNDNLKSYFKAQQVSLQWMPVLRVLALEMSENADVNTLHHLFSNIGSRFATDAQDCFEDVQTLTQLKENLNDFWMRINWGWVELTEVKGGIDITHHAAPLAEAFGDEMLEWSSGLLEGFYQHIFKQLDKSGAMLVRTIDIAPDGMELHFRFELKSK